MVKCLPLEMIYTYFWEILEDNVEFGVGSRFVLYSLKQDLCV